MIFKKAIRGNAQDDTMILILLLIAGLFFFMLWFIPLANAYITKYVLWISNFYRFLPWVEEARLAILNNNGNYIHFNIALFPFWFLALVPLFYVRKIITLSPSLRYKRKISKDALLRQNALRFFAVRPIVGINFVKLDYFKEPWSVPLSELEFLLHHKMEPLLELKTEAVIYHPKFLELKEILRKQLIYLSPGVKISQKIPAYYKAIAVACGFRALGDVCPDFLKPKLKARGVKKPSLYFLERYANSYYEPFAIEKSPILDPKKLDMTDVDQAWEWLSQQSLIKKICYRHAYWETKLCGLLLAGRVYGILMESDFIWLRPMDKRLFLALANLGGLGFYAETMIIGIHFSLENLRDQSMIPFYYLENAALSLVEQQKERYRLLKEEKIKSEFSENENGALRWEERWEWV
jgi:intracellular multiplication protein IcmP